MLDDLAIILVAIIVGLIAGRFLNIVGFLLVVVSPTMMIVILGAVAGRFDLEWWTYPATWIGQQAAFFGSLHLVRPDAYRIMLDRVRMMKNY